MFLEVGLEYCILPFPTSIAQRKVDLPDLAELVIFPLPLFGRKKMCLSHSPKHLPKFRRAYNLPMNWLFLLGARHS